MFLFVQLLFIHKHNTIKDRTETEEPFNGDYDGDEKNFHLPQNMHAKAEMIHISHIRHNTIDPASSSPVFVPVQGTMCGLYLMSDVTLRIPVDLACNMVMECRYARKTVKEAFGQDFAQFEDIEATRVLDLLWPSDFTFQAKGVKIINGRIHEDSKLISKKHLSGSGSLMHLLALNYGEPAIVEFVSDLGRVVRLFMRDYWGFSVSYDDILLEPHIDTQLREDIMEIMEEANEFKGELDQLRILSQTSEAVKHALGSSNMYKRSNMRVMIDSGSKGKDVNFEQIAGCLGQQIVGSSRPECDESGRALSCFKPGDTDVRCFGFVDKSYTEGMTPAQNSFHARGAREGVTETQCGTAKSGYLQRRFQKLMENVKAVFDVHGISVRNGRNAVVMLFYLNGFFTKNVEPVQLECLVEPLPPFQDISEKASPELVPSTRVRFPELYAWYLELEPMRIQLLESRQRCSSSREPNFQFMMPLNVERWICDTHNSIIDTDKFPMEGTIDEALLDIHRFLDNLPTQFHAAAAFKYHIGRTLLEMWLEDGIFNLCVPLLKKLKTDLQSRIAKAAVEAGTALGGLGASSAAKNITQATLNSFHSAGAGSAETKTGIDRAKELVEVSVTGVAQVRVQARVHKINENKAALQKVAKNLLPVRLVDIVKDTNIFKPGPTALRAMIRARKHPLLHRESLPQNVWSVVFILDREKLCLSDLTVSAAARALSTTVTAPFRFSPWNFKSQKRMAQQLNQRSPTLTVYFSADTFLESDVHAQSVVLLDVLLAGYKQVISANVFSASQPNTYEIRATVKPLKKTDQASALRPFFQNSEFFDVEHLYCNSLPIVHHVYGIEAALLTLFTELYSTVCNSGFVHSHHIYLLCVVICITGRPLPVTRHGMKAKGTDVLQLASFEQPRAVFTTAALHGDASVNVKHCLSSSSIIGGIAGVGTGTVEIVTDPTYKQLWDDFQAKSLEEESTKTQKACHQGLDIDAQTRRTHLELKHEIQSMPVALRPTQFWDLEEDIPRLLHQFRSFAVDWVVTHPQIVQRTTQMQTLSDFRRQEAHARRQKEKVLELEKSKHLQPSKQSEKLVNDDADASPHCKRRKKDKQKKRGKKDKRKKQKRRRKRKRSDDNVNAEKQDWFESDVVFNELSTMRNEFEIGSFDNV